MDPGEKIQEASVREVREETGIEAEFLGIMGIRELANFKYGCSDFYFGCILFNKSTQMAIEDVQEVKQAAWFPLSAITHNDKDPRPEIPLYPTAYQYVKEIQRQVEQYNAGAAQDQSIEDYLRARNLCKPAEAAPQEEGAKPKKFNFYTFGGVSVDY